MKSLKDKRRKRRKSRKRKAAADSGLKRTRSVKELEDKINDYKETLDIIEEQKNIFINLVEDSKKKLNMKIIKLSKMLTLRARSPEI